MILWLSVFQQFIITFINATKTKKKKTKNKYLSNVLLIFKKQVAR